MKSFWCNGKQDFCEHSGLSNDEEVLRNVTVCGSCAYLDCTGGEVKDIPDDKIDFYRKKGFNVRL